MKLIFKIGKADFLVENSPNFIPQIGYTVKIFDKLYNVDSILIDYDAPKEDETIIIQLSSLEAVKPSLNTVTVRRLWKQNANSLTLFKSYEVVQRLETKFCIVDDNGKLKWFKNDNLQFK